MQKVSEPMKKTFLAAIIFSATLGHAIAQAPSMSFTGPTNWTPGTQITLSASLTYTGFDALAFTYWLQTNPAVAPFLSITNLSHFTFPMGYTGPYPILFHASGGEDVDLGGGAVNATNIKAIAPGTYHVTDITFSLAPGAPVGDYMLLTSNTPPRVSQITDIDFNDHNIAQSSFAFHVVPEPSTLALFGLGAASSVLIRRRRKSAE